MPEDDVALAGAIEDQALGRPWQAQAQLQLLAEAGNLAAMERLALLHWYGPRLYPGAAWDRALARRWFERAAAQGSDLGRHMLHLKLATHSPTPSAMR